MKEILVYRDKRWFARTVWVESDDNGIFDRGAFLTTSYQNEAPAVIMGSVQVELDKVKVMDEETRCQVLEIGNQINELMKKRRDLVEASFDKFHTLTWDWMKQHQKPRERYPEPFQHKNAIVALRRGSRVLVDGSTDSVRWGVACKSGKLRKKGPKNAIIEIGKHLIRLPYYVLLPYSYQAYLSERRRIKASKQNIVLTRKLTQMINKP